MSKKLESGMAFDMSKLNKIFAFLSILFLLTTFWVFLDDYIRPWKKVQLEAMQIKRAKLQQQVLEAAKEIDAKKIEELKQSINSETANLVHRKEETAALEKELAKVYRDIQNETIVNGRLNALVGEVNFNYEIAHSHGDHKAEKMLERLHQLKIDFDQSRNRLKEFNGNKTVVLGKLDKIKEAVTNAEKEIAALVGKKDLLEKALSKTDITPVFAVRNAPFVDFLDPTLRIHQIVLDNITDDRFFRQVPKVDRCITCHTFIDQPGFEDQKNPHKTHPNLDLVLGEKSPHPIKKIGCTICHGGEGHRVTDFNSAAHTPKDEIQKEEWVKKYQWHAPHKVPQPMLRTGQTEASCVKCHKGQENIPGTTVFDNGKRNFEKFGCYGCHKMDGWEHKRKPGPSLEFVASKVSKEFFKNWVWDPKVFNAHSKMPSFFNQTNNSKPEHVKMNIAEVNAMADYVWSISKKYSPFMTHSIGNSEKGKALIKEVGCLACHGVEGLEDESNKIKAYSGPYLTGSGSKLDPDWLVSWLKKPSHFQPDTIMPSMRLSDQEANDITAYLMSLKNKKFESLVFEKLDKNSRDDLLLSYLSQFDTVEVAKGKLAVMKDQDRTMELGKRSLGKYGCYSCHKLEGFDGRSPIGPELTKVGAKPLTQFGFAHEKVEHARDSWIIAHLLNPRRWDNGVDKTFKDLTLMPNFYMSKKEAQELAVFLIGHTGEYIPATGVKRYSAQEAYANEGMKVVANFNCTGCHQIDNWRGDILKMYEDDINEGPPRLNGQGHRVQADWFYHFLGNVHKIRPWLKVRMPSYNLTNEQKNKIVMGFQTKSDQETFVDRQSDVVWEPGELEGAKKLFNNLACASCHSQGFASSEPSAPNLYSAKLRLRPTWIKKWLENPQAILPGTVMPSFWENGTSTDTEVFGGDAEKQINSLVKYIQSIGNDRYPEPERR